MGFDWYSWVVIPLLIFTARIIDVSLGTLRIIFLGKGYRKLAALIGFFEILIWLLAIREVLLNLRNFACVIGYAGGFAMGNYVGIWLEEKISIGVVILKIFFSQDHSRFKRYLDRKNIGYTFIKGEGARQTVQILYTVIQRIRLQEAVRMLKKTNPHAFYIVENIKTSRQGVFPLSHRHPVNSLRRKRKAK